MNAKSDGLRRLPARMREAINAVVEPEEDVLEVWGTRGFGANALVCTGSRALIAKRTELLRWSVSAFPYSEIDSAQIFDGRPGAAAQLELVALDSGNARRAPFEEFPDAYYQESRRLVAPNTVMFRNRRKAREAAEIVRDLIAEARYR